MQFTMPGAVSRHAGTWRFIGFPDFGHGIVEHAGCEHSTFFFFGIRAIPFSSSSYFGCALALAKVCMAKTCSSGDFSSVVSGAYAVVWGGHASQRLKGSW